MSSRAMDVRLEFPDRSTHSFWHLVLEGAERTLTAGKVGAKKAPKPKTKTFKSEEAARKSAAKDIAKKRAEGYFDPTSIADVLAYHREHLAIPSDADIAAEVSNFTRSQVLSQAATAMLAQANVVPQTALSLLQ